MKRESLVAVAVVAVLLGLGCGGGRAHERAPAPPPEAPTPTPSEDPIAVDRAAVAAWNGTVRGDTTDTLHGQQVSDPYRQLETDDEATQEWARHQTERSTAFQTEHANAGRETRLAELFSIGLIKYVEMTRDRVFFGSRGERGDFVLMVADRAGDGWGEPRILMDPATFQPSGKLGYFYPSPRGRYLVFGNKTGAGDQTLRVMEVATGRVSTRVVARVSRAWVAWLPDESGFYYTNTARPAQPAPSPDGQSAPPAARARPRRNVYRHRVDARTFAEATAQRQETDVVDDPMVFETDGAGVMPYPELSSDGRWLVVNLFRGGDDQEVHLADMRARVPREGRPRFVPVYRGRGGTGLGTVHAGRLYVMTNEEAPRRRVVSALVAPLMRARPTSSPGQPAAEPAFPLAPAGPWVEVVPQGDLRIETVSITGGRLVLGYLRDVRSVLRHTALDGSDARELTLPDVGTVDEVSGLADSPSLGVVYSDLLRPPSLLSYDLAGSAAPRVVARVPTELDVSGYRVTVDDVVSQDGARVPVYVVHRADVRRDGSTPVLLTSQSGFGWTGRPYFVRHIFYWLERGGAFALAVPRGSLEADDAWRHAAMGPNRIRAFEDLSAVVRWLSTSRLSSPERIALWGEQHGALGVGVLLNRAPETFRAAVTHSGLFDMLRYDQFALDNAAWWRAEYGSPAEAGELPWLTAYSPYQYIRQGGSYPSVWMEATAEAQTHWSHTTKMAARLQDAQAGSQPVYFYLDRELGGDLDPAATRVALVHRYARMYAFIEDRLGVQARH